MQLAWARTSQPIHVNNDWWWCLEHRIPHGPPDWKFLAVLLYCKLAEGWLSSPHWRGQWWGCESAWCDFEDAAPVSVVFSCPLLFRIQHWKETFVAEMAEMAEVVKNQDKRSGQCIVWLCWSDTAVTSLTHFYAPPRSELDSISFFLSYNFPRSNGISNIHPRY